MATATISKSGDDYTISGGSSSDYITIKDIQVAANSDLNAPLRNSAYTTSQKTYKYSCDSNSYTDFTGARIFLRNANNGEIISWRFNGAIRVGSTNDTHGHCEIHFGEYDCGGYNNSRMPIFGTSNNNIIDCPNPNNRIILMSHIQNSSKPAEPGSKNGIWLQNNRSGNKIRISILGAAFTLGSSYVLPEPSGSLENGSSIVTWRIGSNVTVRDIEFKDGYVDWRPSGTWDAPTKGVFISETWVKFFGNKGFTKTSPLIFGNEDDSFEVVVGNSGQTGSYLLHGLTPSSSSATGRIVYNSFKGLLWSTQMALYGKNRPIEVENHIPLSYVLIDSSVQPIDGAVITMYKKDPVYNSDHTDVEFNGSEINFDTTTDSTGKGNIGNADGNLAHNICIEAFCRKNNNSGNVNTAYANKDHPDADYASYTSLYYTIIKWGKKPIIRNPYTAKLSGQVGEGKQSLGVIQMENADALTAPTESAVPTTITDAKSFYDNAYKYALNNKIDLFCTREGNKILTTNSIVFDNSASNIISFSGSVITVKANSFSSSIEASQITFKTAFDLSILSLTGDVHYDLGSNATIEYSRVTSNDDIYNDDTNHTLTINAINNSTVTAGDPGTGNGQTFVQNLVDFKFTVHPSITGYEWRIYEVTNLGSLAGAVELTGQENASSDNQTYTYNYTSDMNVAVQILSQPDNDYVENVTYYILNSTKKETTINLAKDTNN
jgi:hypothetical protein